MTEQFHLYFCKLRCAPPKYVEILFFQLFLTKFSLPFNSIYFSRIILAGCSKITDLKHIHYNYEVKYQRFAVQKCGKEQLQWEFSEFRCAPPPNMQKICYFNHFFEQFLLFQHYIVLQGDLRSMKQKNMHYINEVKYCLLHTFLKITLHNCILLITTEIW